MAALTREGIPTSQSTLIRVIHTDWIEVVAVDRISGDPLAGWTFQLELPDGTVTEGTLDDQGTYRHEGTLPGACIFKVARPQSSDAAS